MTPRRSRRRATLVVREKKKRDRASRRIRAPAVEMDAEVQTRRKY